MYILDILHDLIYTLLKYALVLKRYSPFSINLILKMLI